MTRRKVIWHIGPVDPGTAFLAEALQSRATELAEHGAAVPTGAWHEIEDQIWQHKGLSLLSTPDIAPADADKIALRLNGLRDLEVHLVLLSRDLPAQVYAGWQAGLQHGSTTSLKKYATRVMDPERSDPQAVEFWAGADLGRILPAWTRAFHADRVHVIATPSDADSTWRSFVELAGLGGLERPAGFVPPSLSAELDPERVLDLTTAWAKLVADRGFDLRGSLIGASTTAAIGGPDRASQLEAVAELLTASTTEIDRLSTELTRLRAENLHLDKKRRKHKRRLAELNAAS
ncbi:MAG: hypothetical protein JWP74_1577 [Marmoricola sp.]|nr:hypothetical protein [Marmoricola sp.]